VLQATLNSPAADDIGQGIIPGENLIMNLNENNMQPRYFSVRPA
jgi:hypothetical protein